MQSEPALASTGEGGQPRFAQVAVPVPLGQAFSYRVPAELVPRVVPGARVLCSFGRREVLGVVLDLGDQAPDVPAGKLKSILGVVDALPVLPRELLDFLVELARYYLAPVGEVMRLALPVVARADLKALQQQGLGDKAAIKAVGKLVQVARLTPEDEWSDAARTAHAKLSQVARAALQQLLELGPQPLSQLSASRAVLQRLARVGLIELEQQALAVDTSAAGDLARDQPPQLSPAQAAAVHAITAALDERQASTFLIHGVTGSGKTEVYLHAAARCLQADRSAIVLVPEIALTPQLVQRFRARLGDRIAVLHSGLSPGERRSMWQQLRSGALKVAVGARSALFAPVQDLALICVDEEHDGSFKQEDGVQYNARDMAQLRAHRAGAVCLLGSATPSLQSEWLRRSGKIRYLQLPDRAHPGSALPEVQAIDLRRFGPGPTGDRLITLPLYRALEQVLQQRQQAILFLNRRGFAPSLVCEACGEIAHCPNCAVALTLHKRPRERLVCHYCDHTIAALSSCGKCGSKRLSQEGVGTEGIENTLQLAFPEARIARLDRDVASGSKSEPVLDKVRKGEVDILVGTQMVTKGHDLPNVTLVGVLNADAALSLPDFQASERTFQLLVQVAGRSGRGDDPGRVLVQTHDPEHPAVRFALKHDVAGYVERELQERRDLHYPPFARLALVRVDALDRSLAERAAQALAEIARRTNSRAEVLGPTAAPLSRLRGRYRFRFLIRAAERGPLRQAAQRVLAASVDRRVRVAVDIDPLHML